MGHDLSGPRDRVVAVVQARMSSTRLPGKTLAQLGEHSALELLLIRLRGAREVDEVVVATSKDASDDPIELAARTRGVRTIRGPLADVLARFVQAADSSGADAVVRITADCPLTDPQVVDEVVRCWRATGVDYATNTLEPRSYPDGFDVEVLSLAGLHRAHELAKSAGDREHVTSYLRRHPDVFATAELRLDPELGSVRVTLDTSEDLQLLRQLVLDVGPHGSMRSVLNALGYDTSLVTSRQS